jgi:hypothetical protein
MKLVKTDKEMEGKEDQEEMMQSGLGWVAWALLPFY